MGISFATVAQSKMKFYNITLTANEVFGNPNEVFYPRKAFQHPDLKVPIQISNYTGIMGKLYNTSNFENPRIFLNASSSPDEVSELDKINIDYFARGGIKALDKIYNRQIDTLYEKFRKQIIKHKKYYIYIKTLMDSIVYIKYTESLLDSRFISLEPKTIDKKQLIESELNIKLAADIQALISKVDTEINITSEILKSITNSFTFSAEIQKVELDETYFQDVESRLCNYWITNKDKIRKDFVNETDPILRDMYNFYLDKESSIIAYAIIMKATYEESKGKNFVTDITSLLKGKIPDQELIKLKSEIELTFALKKSKEEESYFKSFTSYYVLGYGNNQMLEIGEGGVSPKCK